MTEIIPAILPRDFADLEEKVSRIAGAAPLVQVDVCDGKFTPHACWPYSRHDDNFEAIVGEEKGMPRWEDIDYEFDLMISNLEEEISNWIIAGSSRIVLHYESVADFPAALARIRTVVGYSRDSFLVPEIGVALNINTPNSVLDGIISEIDFVQFMGIKRIGFQGETMNEEVIEKISTFRKAHPEAIISVDGGVNRDTAPRLVAAGANRLVSGSAILNSESPADAIRELQNV